MNQNDGQEWFQKNKFLPYYQGIQNEPRLGGLIPNPMTEAEIQVERALALVKEAEKNYRDAIKFMIAGILINSAIAVYNIITFGAKK